MEANDSSCGCQNRVGGLQAAVVAVLELGLPGRWVMALSHSYYIYPSISQLLTDIVFEARVPQKYSLRELVMGSI